MSLANKLISGFIYGGMPVVTAYHLVMGNIFLNITAEDAKGLEEIGNKTLSPVQYLLCGKKAVLENGEYRLEQRFSYDNYLPLKTAASFLSLPISLPTGVLLKGLSYFSEETKTRHQKLLFAKESTKVMPNIDYYRRLGLAVDAEATWIDPPAYTRCPGDENKLVLEKELLKELVLILSKNQIPHWVDCGTCLGTYRYGGAIPWDFDIDISILLPDFNNAMHALNTLDKDKYIVEDWSSRCRPETYIRVYIRENRNYIDIYHAAIDPEKKTLTYIISFEESSFMPESWKIHERRFSKPSDFDTIFPLKKASFDGIEVFVPNKTVKYLQERYGENLAPVYIYNKATAKYEKDLSHPYWQLPDAY